jgi:hypothetical protein
MANDIIDINVYETVETVTINVEPNLTTVNINQIAPGEGGNTNLGYTPSPTNGIVTSDTGTDATIPLANSTNAGLLTPAEKTKIANSVPYTGATEDVDLGFKDLYLEKLWLRDDPNDNYGSVHYTDGNFHIEDGDGNLLFVIEDGYIQLHKTGTIQSNLYTSGLSQTRDHYLPNASGTIALTSDLNLNGLSDVVVTTPQNNQLLVYETATALWKNKDVIINDSDFASAFNTYSSEYMNDSLNGILETNPYSFRANNTQFTAIGQYQAFRNLTNQTYSGTIVWSGGAAPSGATQHTYSISQIGNLVTLTINLAYATAGAATLSSVACELPSTAPTPALPASVSAVGEVLNYGSGMITGTRQIPSTIVSFCALRIKSTSPNVYEIAVTRGTGSYRYAYITIQYFV